MFVLGEEKMKREWEKIEYFDKSFDYRTKALIDLLSYEEKAHCFANMLDIGCGLQYAKRYFADKYNIDYCGLDYKPRSNDTIVCDLNKKQFHDVKFDLFLVAGCLEYVIFVEWFFDQISKYCRKCLLLSYCTLELNPDIEQRNYNAWKNCFEKQEIVSILLNYFQFFI